MHSYHNTANECGRQLQRYEDKALAQDERLMAYFELAYNSGGGYILLTPTDALERVFTNSVPITSVRRAMSNLTKAGKLEKSGKVMGPYGRAEHYWRMVERSGQQALL